MSSRDLRLVYGYVRVGDGPPERVLVQREALRDLATELGLLLGMVFTDYQPHKTERPEFRALLDVVHALRPHAVLVPSAWHLSQRPGRRAGLLDQFRSMGCSVLAAHRGKASVLVTGRAGSAAASS